MPAPTAGHVSASAPLLKPGIQKIVGGVNAARAEQGDAHRVAHPDGADAWFAVHIVGALILRLAKRAADVAEDDIAVSYGRMTGTHTGDLMGLPPSGRQIDLPTIGILRFADGRAVERWGLVDNMTMMQQLGLLG